MDDQVPDGPNRGRLSPILGGCAVTFLFALVSSATMGLGLGLATSLAATRAMIASGRTEYWTVEGQG